MTKGWFSANLNVQVRGIRRACLTGIQKSPSPPARGGGPFFLLAHSDGETCDKGTRPDSNRGAVARGGFMKFHSRPHRRSCSKRKLPARSMLGQIERIGVSERSFSKSRFPSSVNDTSNLATPSQKTSSRLVLELDPRFSWNSFQKLAPEGRAVEDLRRGAATQVCGGLESHCHRSAAYNCIASCSDSSEGGFRYARH